MTRAAILLHGRSLLATYRDEWFERYQAVYALNHAATFFRHHYRCHLDQPWRSQIPPFEAAILNEAYFQATNSPLWLAGCRYTSALVLEHALANHDEAHLFGLDQEGRATHLHLYDQAHWNSEAPWLRRIWNERCLSFGGRKEP